MDLPKVAFVVSVSTAKYPRERIIIEGDEDNHNGWQDANCGERVAYANNDGHYKCNHPIAT